MNYLNRAFILMTLLSSMTPLFLGGCSSSSVNENNPEELYKDAEEDVTDKRYLQAVDKLKTVKNKFPYSAFSTKAALRLADVLFLEESYVEAAVSYENFRDLHPKSEQADYVIFRIGESYFNQLPDSEDRDQTPATKAIEAYQELIKLYPSSQYAPQAREKALAATERLAAKEKYIADFYYKREMYDSAAIRYEKITKKFAQTQIVQTAYMRWAASLLSQNKNDEAKHVYNVYLSQFPKGQYVRDSEKALQRLQ